MSDGKPNPRIRDSAGGAYESRGRFFIRVTVAPQKRPSKMLPWCTSLADAVERAHVVQAHVNRLRSAGQFDFIDKVVEIGAEADAETLTALARKVDAIVGDHFERMTPKDDGRGPITFAKFAETWTDGTLRTRFPSHVEEKKSVRDDEYRFGVLADLIGNVPLVAFTLDHADDAMRRLDEVRRTRAGRDVKALDPGGRRQYAQLIARTLKLAAYPARIIKATPLPSGWLPRVPNNKAKGLLYPDEEATTLGCTKYDVHWRVFFGFLARSGFRADEAAGLAKKDVDLVRGIITLDENKTDDPRAPRFGADVMIALRAWAEKYRKGAKDDDLFFTRPDGERIAIDGLADFYREHFVRDAGVARAELFARSKSRLALRVHDLRGFFVTYSLAGGATETWVMDRTGHKSSTMVNRYRRVARTVAEAGLGSPVPLHLAIPELGELAAAFTAANAAADTKKEIPKSRAGARKHKQNGLVAQLVELRTFNP